MATVVVGLGNPGPRYVDTRHNVGQGVVDRLAERFGVGFRRSGPAQVAETSCAAAPLFLAKPVAFMNVVGPSVTRLLRRLELGPEHVVAIHDDLDLPFGAVRVRLGGGHGGHNGMRSLIESLRTEAVRRVKVGIGRPDGDAGEDVVSWVLTPFTPDERIVLPEVLEQASDAVLRLLVSPTPG